MSCYLLFKKPMKYLVPRGSGRPTVPVGRSVGRSSNTRQHVNKLKTSGPQNCLAVLDPVLIYIIFAIHHHNINLVLLVPTLQAEKDSKRVFVQLTSNRCHRDFIWWAQTGENSGY